MHAFTKLAAAVAAFAIPAAAQAAVTVNINEVGGDVVATLAGTLDTTGLAFYSTFTLDVGINSTPAYIGFGTQDVLVSGYTGFSGPASIGGAAVFTYADSSTGSNFALNGGSFGSPFVFLDPGFVSGSALAGTSTFLGTSLAALNLTTGTYVYTSGADTITINVGPGGVPEPATWAMMIGGFGLAGGALRRRARTTVAYA